MTKTLLLAVIACFVTITTATSFSGNGQVVAFNNKMSGIHDYVADISSKDSQDRLEFDDECTCTKNKDSLSLVCGVTLALLAENALGYSKPPIRSQCLSNDMPTDLGLVWKLKRPPRLIA